jgi:predicted O-methyltransferase YrrM
MFGKVVTLNKKDYVVSLDEYKEIPHYEYNNLKIIDKLGEHERLVSLINEISNIFDVKNNKYAVSMGLSHGGYIPINIANKYDNVYVYEIDKNKLKYMDYNIEYHTVCNIRLNTIFNIKNDQNNNFLVYCDKMDKESNYEMDNVYNKIIQMTNLNPVLIIPNYFYERYIFLNYSCYILSKSDYCVLVPDVLLKLFRKNFYYYIKQSNDNIHEILEYDNLIHLTMIVKNAGEKFEEVLTRNLPIIDRWTILDTGSTDNTIDIIKKVLVGKKKGELFQEPFIDFGESRNRCLQLAGDSCKYKLMLDDTYIIEGELRDFLEVTRGDQFSDSFSLYITSDDVQYCSNRITKTTSNLKYIYKIHEVIQMENNVNVCVPISKARIFDVRADYMEKRTMDRKDYDLKLLFEMVEELPNDPRHLYYIGQTYNILKKHELAFEYFMKRVEHPVEGNLQEKLDACFEAARLANFFLNRPWEECEKIYWRVFEMDKTRPEAMYFIGIHHYLENNKYEAYRYMKQAFDIGYPVHCQYSLKPTLSFHFVPKFLSELCYFYNDYETGEQCCKLFLEKKIMGEDYYEIMKSWHDIFVIMNKYNVKNININPYKPEKPYFCFLADGGFNKWSGSTILKQGVGGSETYIIELARYIQRSGKYNVVVFCNCENNEIFEGVEYKHILEYFDFVREISVEHCIISRYSEYIPFTLKSNVQNVYFVAHDLTPTGLVFPLEDKFKKVFCLSEWHVEHFTSVIPQLKHITEPFYYGIDKELFDSNNTRKKPYKFIYSSFAHRGLLALLQMWPRIIKKYSSASLYIHCDVENQWVNENAKDHMKLLKEVMYNMLKETKYNIYYMGWTSKDKLAQSWKTADVWLYPCIFRETFCLTALEAAISKTLVVTNDLAALKNTAGDRGVIVPIGDELISEKWYDECLNKMFDVLDNREKLEYYINKNYEWAKNMTWENRANDLLKLLDCKNNKVNKNIEIVKEKEDHGTQKYIDNTLIYKGMYNWTNDLPEGSRDIFIEMLKQFNQFNNKYNKQILEIGTYTGVSIINIMDNIPNSSGTVIDSWTDYKEINSEFITGKIKQNNIEKYFYDNLKVKKLENRVKVFKGDSTENLIEIIKLNNENNGLKGDKLLKFDLIYIDGSHRLLDCYVDLILSWELLEKNGMMIIDDYLFNKDNVLESPYEAVNQFLDKYKNKYTLLHKSYRVFLIKN